MNIIRWKSLNYQASSHEDPKDPGVMKKVLLRSRDIAKGKIQMINWARLGVSSSFEPHFHEDMEEVFIMITGHVKIRVVDEEDELRSGDTIVIPEKSVHQMWNMGEKDAEYLALGVSRESGGKTIVVSAGFKHL